MMRIMLKGNTKVALYFLIYSVHYLCLTNLAHKSAQEISQQREYTQNDPTLFLLKKTMNPLLRNQVHFEFWL